MNIVWSVFMLGALCLFVYSFIMYKKTVVKYFLIGAFLLVFDFIIETTGGILGLWVSTGSLLLIGYVPIEVMVMCLFGGTGWAIQFDNRVRYKDHYLFFLIVSGICGAFGEQILIECGVMSYGNWWNLYCALVAYILTSLLLMLLIKKCLRCGKNY